MIWYYIFTFFIFGTVLGSFYNVVGYRLPKGESLISPPSHCPNCNHRLSPLELIPIFSFLLQGGKCKNCKRKISWFYPIFEFSSGVLFGLSFYLFGFSWNLLIALIFISALLIVIISDYQCFIICDEVLAVATILILLVKWIAFGPWNVLLALMNGAISFLIMYLIKKLGDFIFKKESMGFGDIKLMFLIGLTLSYQSAILSIFLSSFLGLPVALFIMYKKRDHVLPFGPFLSISAMILLFTSFNFQTLLDFMQHLY